MAVAKPSIGCVVCDREVSRFSSGKPKKRCSLCIERGACAPAKSLLPLRASKGCVFCGAQTGTFKNGQPLARCEKHKERGGINSDPVKTLENQRRWQAANRDKTREYGRRSARRQTANGHKREYKRRYRKRLLDKGLSCRGRPIGTWKRYLYTPAAFDQAQTRLAKANALQAWIYWLKVKAPRKWLRAYYRASGEPWKAPWLTAAHSWRIRYWCNPLFRAEQILRAHLAKERRAKWIAETEDGTLTPQYVCSLFASAKDCPYCSKRMRSVEKSLDHVVPLSRGGAHAAANVLVCCLNCNVKKGSGKLLRTQAIDTPHVLAGPNGVRRHERSP